jgi:SAM-dependent methyltransferase
MSKMIYASTNMEKHLTKSLFSRKLMGEFYVSVSGLCNSIGAKNILNIGCGEGFDIKKITEINKTNPYYCGMDISFSALKIARQALSEIHFDEVNADIYHLPFRLNKFDLILCLEVLEHLSFPERALEQLQHFSGKCIFSVPFEPRYRLTRMLLLRRNIRQFGDHPEHVNHWSSKTFSRLIRKYFEIDKIITPYPWVVVLCHGK